jgi:hypothetical protein
MSGTVTLTTSESRVTTKNPSTAASSAPDARRPDVAGSAAVSGVDTTVPFAVLVLGVVVSGR